MKKIMVILIFALFLFTGISYALLSDTIKVNGTATAVGTFDVNIIDAVVNEEVGSIDSTISISSDKKAVILDVPALEYPGSYVKFLITVKNEGNISAKLIDIVEKNMGDNNVGVSYSRIRENSILDPNEILSFIVKVEWKSVSTSSSIAGTSIDIDFVYEQNI